MPCAPLAVSSPPWGGGGRVQKKKTKWGGMLVHYRILMSHLGASMSVLGSHSFLPWSRTRSVDAQKKKWGGKERLHTRATIATPPLRRLRPCLLLLPGGALLADRDGLRTAVSAFGRFFA